MNRNHFGLVAVVALSSSLLACPGPGPQVDWAGTYAGDAASNGTCLTTATVPASITIAATDKTHLQLTHSQLPFCPALSAAVPEGEASNATITSISCSKDAWTYSVSGAVSLTDNELNATISITGSRLDPYTTCQGAIGGKYVRQ
jgi:hypothetical protein